MKRLDLKVAPAIPGTAQAPSFLYVEWDADRQPHVTVGGFVPTVDLPDLQERMLRLADLLREANREQNKGTS